MNNNKSDIIEHVFYEFSMYIETFFRWIFCGEQGQIEKNLVVDSHQLHLRNIMDFFSNVEKQDDIVLSTILNDTSSFEFDSSKYLSQKKNICKGVTHLTRARCTIDKKETDRIVKQMAKVILPLIKQTICELENESNSKYYEQIKNLDISILKKRIEWAIQLTKILNCSTQN